jgi:hypothetical protein
VEKGSPKMWAASEIFIKIPKVNNHPLGANSPNLVTLFATKTASSSFSPLLNKSLAAL